MLSMTIRLDLGEFDRRLENIMTHERQAIANALTTTARAGRKAFTAKVIPDSVGGAKTTIKAALRSQVSNVRSATAGNLTAIQIVRLSRFGVSPQLRNVAKGNQHKPGGATIGTFMLTGGGSADLTSGKFFVIDANGGKVILESRPGIHRQGRRLTRAEVKKIYAEMPITAFAQENSVPRQAWDLAIDTTLTTSVAANLQTVFDGASAPGPVGSEGE